MGLTVGVTMNLILGFIFGILYLNQVRASGNLFMG
jgi:hypothetical protein